jgi:hypothetical protein
MGFAPSAASGIIPVSSISGTIDEAPYFFLSGPSANKSHKRTRNPTPTAAMAIHVPSLSIQGSGSLISALHTQRRKLRQRRLVEPHHLDHQIIELMEAFRLDGLEPMSQQSMVCGI